MKVNLIQFILIIGIAFNCQSSNSNRFNEFYEKLDFTYFDHQNCMFSVVFTTNDSLYVIDHRNLDKTEAPSYYGNYSGKMDNDFKEKFKFFLRKTKIFEMDSTYSTNSNSGIKYKFYLKKGGMEKSVYVYKTGKVKELDEFAFWIVNLVANTKLKKYDKDLDVISFYHFVP